VHPASMLSGISAGSVFSNLYPWYLLLVFISLLFTVNISYSNTCTLCVSVCVSPATSFPSW